MGDSNGDQCQWFHVMVNFIFTAIRRDKPLWPAGAVISDFVTLQKFSFSQKSKLSPQTETTTKFPDHLLRKPANCRAPASQIHFKLI
jgi:hypothetical protein